MLMPAREGKTDVLLRELELAVARSGMTVGVVESATGGLVSHLITNIPGCSQYYKGSVTSYSNQIKIGLVGVNGDTITRYGAVSEQVSREMAWGGRNILAVDICLADTGIAGPGGASPGKPVGLFYIGLADKEGTYSRRYQFDGNREEIKLAAAYAVIDWLREYCI